MAAYRTNWFNVRNGVPPFAFLKEGAVAVDTEHTEKVTEGYQLSAFVPHVVRDGLQQLAEAHERTLSAEIRVALRRHVETSTPKTSAASAAGRSH